MRVVLLVAGALLSCQRAPVPAEPGREPTREPVRQPASKSENPFPSDRPRRAYLCQGLQYDPRTWWYSPEPQPEPAIEIKAEQLSLCDSFVAEVVDVSEGTATNDNPAALVLRITEPLLGGEAGELRRAVFRPELAPEPCGAEREISEARFAKEPASIPLIGSRYIVTGGWSAGKRWFVAPEWAAVPYTSSSWRKWKSAVEKAMAKVPTLSAERAAADVHVRDAALDARQR